jgi:hypothetical protein
MTQLTLNNTQLLFVRVPMEAIDIGHCTYYYGAELDYFDCALLDHVSIKLPENAREIELLGTIQKEKGVVSTTIEDEVLEEILGNITVDRLAMLDFKLEESGFTLQEGDKYAVLKIK